MGLSAEVMHCPMKCISQYPSYSQSVWKHKSLCDFLFHLSVPCLSLYMLRGAAYEHNQPGLMHIQPPYLRSCTSWDVAGIESWAGGQRQLHSRSVTQHGSLLGKYMLFYVWYGTMLEHQMCSINTAHWPCKAPLLQQRSAVQAEVSWLSSFLPGNWWEIMMFSEWNNLCTEGHSSERCQFYPNYKALLQSLFLKQIFTFPSRNKHSTCWTKIIKMHCSVCLWTRSWASLTLCSCWTQGDAQTPAGHISKDIWG